MSYQNVLDECLTRLRRGESVDALVAAYPQHADRLRGDLAAASAARTFTASLPGVSATARQTFRANLQSQRASREVRPPRSLWPRFKTPAFAFAAVAGLAIALFVTLGGVLPTQTAEAGTIEGVVVDTADGRLTLQTKDGVETITVQDTATVSDVAGSAVALASLEPGQFVTIRGSRRDAGEFQARRIELQAATRLEAWCEQFATSCVALERTLAQRAAECVRDVPACQGIRTRLDLVREKIATAARLTTLQERCDGGQNAACRDIQAFCAANPAACESIRDWLRTRRLR
jgi:hypothetical protein